MFDGYRMSLFAVFAILKYPDFNFRFTDYVYDPISNMIYKYPRNDETACQARTSCAKNQVQIRPA